MRFYPVHGTFSVSVWSDPLFNIAISLLVICFLEMLNNTAAFFRSRSYIFFFLLSSIVMTLIRNNGIYIFILTLPFLFYYIKKERLKIAIYCIICLSLFFLIKGVVYNALKVAPIPIYKALSIPIQQINRTVIKHDAQLTAEEKNSISRFFDYDKLKNTYDSKDSWLVIKACHDDYLKNNQSEFFKLWWLLLCKYPSTFMDSFLSGNYGYWYPEVKNWIISGYIHENNYGIHEVKLLPKQVSPSFVISLVSKLRSIPIISLLFSIGFMVWCTIVSTSLCLVMNKKQLLLIFIPLYALLLTALKLRF